MQCVHLQRRSNLLSPSPVQGTARSVWCWFPEAVTRVTAQGTSVFCSVYSVSALYKGRKKRLPVVACRRSNSLVWNVYIEQRQHCRLTMCLFCWISAVDGADNIYCSAVSVTLETCCPGLWVVHWNLLRVRAVPDGGVGGYVNGGYQRACCTYPNYIWVWTAMVE
jgi:hypothetical protein